MPLVGAAWAVQHGRARPSHPGQTLLHVRPGEGHHGRGARPLDPE